MSRLGGALRKAYEVSPETVKRAAGGVMRLLPERMPMAPRTSGTPAPGRV